METIEQAAQQYAVSLHKNDSDSVLGQYVRSECYTAFLAGADWQSRQTQSKNQNERRTIKFCVHGKIWDAKSSRSADSNLWIAFCKEPTLKEIFDKVEESWSGDWEVETITRL